MYSLSIYSSEGKRNYRFFIQLLIHVLIYLLIVETCCLVVVIKTRPLLFTYEPIVALVLTILVFIFFSLVSYLFLFHLFLIASNQTTNEFNKNRRIFGLNRQRENKIAQIISNFWLLICSPITISFKVLTIL